MNAQTFCIDGRTITIDTRSHEEHFDNLKTAVENGFNDATGIKLAGMNMDTINNYDIDGELLWCMLETASLAEKYLKTGEQTNDTELHHFDATRMLGIDWNAVDGEG